MKSRSNKKIIMEILTFLKIVPNIRKLGNRTKKTLVTEDDIALIPCYEPSPKLNLLDEDNLNDFIFYLFL